MLPAYDDIIDLIAAKPVWWNENGVPRYRPFHPTMLASIFLNEGALLEIECQTCRRPFAVAVSQVNLHNAMQVDGDGPPISLADLIDAHRVCYGDAPNIGCCEAGFVQTSIPIRILEYWFLTKALNWQRDSKFEIDFPKYLG